MAVSSSDSEPTLRGYARGQRVFGRYILADILGRGGMGVVWCAYDETLGEDVALKFLPDAVRWDPGALDDLKAETRRARQLTHPNIVRIHDFIADSSAAAITMELVEGRTLTALRLEKENKVLEPVDIFPWLPQLVAALEYAHEQAKVVHRDLKPANLMLTSSGVLKVADFGVARSLMDSVTRVSMMSAGTLVYMSPQQAMGEEPSPADDIYAVGATLYELLTGKPPFHTGDVRMQLFQRKPDSIAARRRTAGVPLPTVPCEWENTITACLAKEPAERPANMRAIIASLVVSSNGSPGKSPSPRWRRLAVTMAVVLAAAGAALWYRSRGSVSSGAAIPAAGFPSDATRALAAWNFDGDGKDASGHELHTLGAGSGVPTTDRFGRIDRALHFNGTTTLVTDDARCWRWSGDEPFSIALWVRTAASSPLSQCFVASLPGAVGENYWALSFAGSVVTFKIGRLNEEGASEASGTVSGPDDNWRHIGAVSDGRTLALFLDGKKAAEIALGPRAIGATPKSAQLRFGSLDVYARSGFVGDMDDVRLWRRAVTGPEMTRLAARDAPPRFAPTRGVYSEQSNLAEAVVDEFGPTAKLGDWESLSRWHQDDVRALANESGLMVGAGDLLVQRAGTRISESPRHYFISRFDGQKPDYFAAHAELGGMSVALGSWYGASMRALAEFADVIPRRERRQSTATGLVQRTFQVEERVSKIAATWRLKIGHGTADTARVDFHLRNGQTVSGICAGSDNGKLALALSSGVGGERTLQLAAVHEAMDFTAVLAEGAFKFRAATAVGGSPVFQEEVKLPGFHCAEIERLTVSGVDVADLIIE